MARALQKHMARALRQHGNSTARALQEHGNLIARSWQEHDKSRCSGSMDGRQLLSTNTRVGGATLRIPALAGNFPSVAPFVDRPPLTIAITISTGARLPALSPMTFQWLVDGTLQSRKHRVGGKKATARRSGRGRTRNGGWRQRPLAQRRAGFHKAKLEGRRVRRRNSWKSATRVRPQTSIRRRL